MGLLGSGQPLGDGRRRPCAGGRSRRGGGLLLATAATGCFAAAAVASLLTAASRAFISGPAPGRGAFRGGSPETAASVARAAAEVAAAGDVATSEELAAGAVALAALDIPSIENVSDVISEAEFWSQIEASEVEEAILFSWSGRRLMAKLKDGSFKVVDEESDAEDLRNRLVKAGVRFRYLPGDMLTDEEALAKQEFTSEGATAAGMLTAAAVGVLDTFVGFEAGEWVIGGTGGAVVSQSLLEGESPQQVIAEDLGTIGKDIQLLEKAAEQGEKILEADVKIAEQFASQEVTQAEGALGQIGPWFQAVSRGLVENHAPGIGGIIEDSFMALLVAVSLYSLYKQAYLKRKSSSWAGLAHTATGAMQIGIVVYAIIEERCLRESPGPVWAIFTFIIFMVNNITMWPLLKYFRGPEVYRVLFKLAYSFIISFQGIHCIAFSSQYPWLYWWVMPFWFYSVKKLAESSDNIFALLPDGTIPIEGVQEAAKRRVKGIQNDTPTLVYSILNFAGAVFDNLYMAVYTWRGPEGFWGWSQANIPAVNDHLRTGLVKPAFGSLTISVLVFLGTLVYRKQMPSNLGIALNVILASVGPWLILYYHKLIDWDEPWQPEIAGDWGSSPYFINHLDDLTAFLAIPLALVGGGKAYAAVTGNAASGSTVPGELADATAAAAAGAAEAAAEVAAPAQVLPGGADSLPFDPLRLR